MANKSNKSNKKDEPSTAPEPDRWYNISLGSSFMDHQPSPKFCSLRYEFKPASIDKTQPGSLHKKRDSRVNVEFHNNQLGKAKVIFEGVSEDLKDNDAVLFFDGETFRLEPLHRAVKRLRHVRLPGESTPVATLALATTSVGPVVESYSPPVAEGTKLEVLDKVEIYRKPVEVEGIDMGNSESLAQSENGMDINTTPKLNPSSLSPDCKNDELEENVDIMNDNDKGSGMEKQGNATEREFNTGIDINIPLQIDTDDEIADVDVSDGEEDKGCNAAEALRAQVNAERTKEQTSSSSSSSGSGTSDSESGSKSESSSSSSDSESSDGCSVSSI